MEKRKIVILFFVSFLLASNLVLADIKETALRLNRLKILDGDANADGKVDIFDLAIIGLFYDTKETDENWNWKVDIANSVGEIDIFDLAEVGLNYGKNYNQVIDDPVFISPQSRNVNVGDEFLVDVNISTQSQIFALEFTLNFEPSIIEIISVTEGNFLKKDGSSTYPIININNTEGKIEFANTRFGVQTGVSGDGSLAIINFRAKEVGISNLNITKFLAVDNNLNEIPGIPTVNGEVNVQPIGQNPPVLSDLPDKNVDEDVTPPTNWIDLWNYASDVEDTDEQLTFSIQSQSNSVLINCYISGNRYLNCNKPAADQNGYSDVVVKVTDTAEASDTDTTRITVNPINNLPVANANGPYTANEGIEVQLDGSESYDVDGPITNYLWDLDNDGQFNDASGMLVKKTWNNEYFEQICLKVIGNLGTEEDSDINCTTLTINNVPPTAPIVKIAPSLPKTADDLVCEIIRESVDVDAVTYEYAWYKNSVLVGGEITNTLSASLTKKGEKWKCRVIPTDGVEFGASAEDEVTIQNSAPTIDSFSPLTNPTINEKETQDFSITASDVDGNSLTTKWYLDGIEVVSGNSYTYTSDCNSQGTHEIKAIVSDGQSTAEKIWQLTVLDTCTRTQLKAGNNIFSLPRNQQKTFNQLDTNCNVVIENGRADLAYYQPNALDLINESNYVFVGLNNVLYPGQGYFVKVENDCYIEMSGNTIMIGDLGYLNTKQLKEGWNLIGSTTSSIGFSTGTCSLFSGIGILKYGYNVASCQEVEGYNGGYAYCSIEKGISRCRCEVDNFEPGLGYWIRTANDCSLA